MRKWDLFRMFLVVLWLGLPFLLGSFAALLWEEGVTVFWGSDPDKLEMFHGFRTLAWASVWVEMLWLPFAFWFVDFWGYGGETI